MKNLITPSYVFTPGGSGVGTIDTNIVNFDIKLLYAIVNVTREAIIYTPAISGRGYTSITGDTITLEFSTTGMNSGDILQFIYDSTVDYPSYVNTGQAQPLTHAQTTRGQADTSLPTAKKHFLSWMNRLIDGPCLGTHRPLVRLKFISPHKYQQVVSHRQVKPLLLYRLHHPNLQIQQHHRQMHCCQQISHFILACFRPNYTENYCGYICNSKYWYV